MDGKEYFLKDLAELSKKHGIFIEGCGCCNSPYLLLGDEVKYDDRHSKRIEWDDEKGYYVESEY